MTAQRMTNDQKEATFAEFGVGTDPDIKIVVNDDDMFILGPSNYDGTYAFGERDGDDWLIKSNVPGDLPLVKLALALAEIHNALGE